VVKFDFSHSKLRKQPFFAENFKIQGGLGPSSDAYDCSRCIHEVYLVRWWWPRSLPSSSDVQSCELNVSCCDRPVHSLSLRSCYTL